MAPLHVFLSDAERALSEGPLGAVWRRPDGTARAHLCERLVWRLTIPPAAAAIRIADPARPLEAVSRDGPSLREWASQAAPSSKRARGTWRAGAAGRSVPRHQPHREEDPGVAGAPPAAIGRRPGCDPARLGAAARAPAGQPGSLRPGRVHRQGSGRRGGTPSSLLPGRPRSEAAGRAGRSAAASLRPARDRGRLDAEEAGGRQARRPCCASSITPLGSIASSSG